MRNLRRLLAQRADGFTLVEMLAVAPIVLIVIAVLVGAMVAMIGDALVANARAETAFDTQDALNRIEQDSRLSVNFMDKFSFFDSPQGRDGGSAPFAKSSGDLILTSQATTSNPYDLNRRLVYYRNQPNECDSTNRTLLYRTVYFLDAKQTLWRRVIVNKWQKVGPAPNVIPEGVCEKPWQRDTCANGSGGRCVTKDERMLDNVTQFVNTYYDKRGAITTDPGEALTVKVQLASSREVAGKTIAQRGTVEVTRLNDIPSAPAPAAPTISVLNPDVATFNNASLITLQWNSPGALAYQVTPKIDGITQPSFTTAKTTYEFPMQPNKQLSVTIIAMNDSGISPAQTFTTTSKIFANLNLEDTSVAYDPAQYGDPGFTITPAGVVNLRGMISAKDNTLIATLPPKFRPSKRIMFTTMMQGSTAGWISVNINGEVMYHSRRDAAGTILAPEPAWVSLAPVSFLASQNTPSRTLIASSPTGFQCPTGCTNPWRDYTGSGGGGNYLESGFALDSVGRAHFVGLAYTPSPGTVPKSGTIAKLPNDSFYTSASSTNAEIYPSGASYMYTDYTIWGANLNYNQLMGTFMPFASLYYPYKATAPTVPSLTWQTPGTLQNGWTSYSGSFAPFSYIKASDNLVTLRGTIKGGTTTAGTTIFELPVGYCPSKRLMFITAANDTTTGARSTRIDILPQSSRTCLVQIVGTPGGNNWQSLSGISFYQDG